MASVTLVSGGLDSLAVWRLLGNEGMFFRTGTEANFNEYVAVEAFAEKHGLVLHVNRALDHLAERELDNGYLPFRNLSFCLEAARDFDDIVIAQVAEWAPDKNARYWRRVSRLLTESVRGDYQGVSRRVRVRAPFASFTKGHLLSRYSEAFGDGAGLLMEAWSCYRDGATHCGTCSACQQRIVAEVAAFGRPVTRFRVALVLPVRVTLRDAVRATRGNGLAGVVSMVRRYRETRAAMRVLTTDTAA